MNAQTYRPHPPIVIKGNSDFTASNGVVSGQGIATNPYVVEGWEIEASTVNGITIINTTAYFTIRSVYVHSGIRGVFLTNVTNGQLSGAKVSNNEAGVIVESSAGVSISSSEISSNSQEGVRLLSSVNINVTLSSVFFNNIGISTMLSSRLRIEGGVISSNNQAGIRLESSTKVTISDNRLTGNSQAILLPSASDVLVARNRIEGNGDGVYALGVSYITVSDNLVSGNSVGVYLNAAGVMVSRNIVSNNIRGMDLSFVANATITSNNVSLNGVGTNVSGKNVTITKNVYTLDGLRVAGDLSTYVITPDNLVNERPIIFYKNCSNLDMEQVSVGQLILFDCRNVQISNLTITNGYVGIQLNNVQNATIAGVGINSNNFAGIEIVGSHNITITGDNISNNGVGIALVGGTGVMVYHNNFFYDSVSICDPHACSIQASWNAAYPMGGNFWSYYSGVDNCSGPSQNICPDSDGLGDTPYLSYNPSPSAYGIIDNYPLIAPRLSVPDEDSPHWPSGSVLRTVNIGGDSVSLRWTKAADDTGVVSYRVYQGTTLVATIRGDGYEYEIKALTPGTTYTFGIEAVDWSGNSSTDGPSLTVTTLTSPSEPPFWQQFWYLIVPAAGSAMVIPLLIWRSRNRRRHPSPTPSPGPDPI